MSYLPLREDISHGAKSSVTASLVLVVALVSLVTQNFPLGMNKVF